MPLLRWRSFLKAASATSHLIERSFVDELLERAQSFAKSAFALCFWLTLVIIHNLSEIQKLIDFVPFLFIFINFVKIRLRFLLIYDEVFNFVVLDVA